MNKKELAIFLSKLKAINIPKPSLEQYATDSEIASLVLWTAYMNDDIKNKKIADFGAGHGVLGIGALLLNAKKVFFIEKDNGLIRTLKENLSNVNGSYEILNIDINNFSSRVDTVIQNPPFGVQKKHNDKIFLEKAFELSKTIYSIHKIESGFFIKKIAEENNFDIVDLIKIKMPLKKTMPFHRKRKHNVEVGCWVLRKNQM
ncbi:MAG: METTL5 family protein [Nanoarchaeota archaeon]